MTSKVSHMNRTKKCVVTHTIVFNFVHVSLQPARAWFNKKS